MEQGIENQENLLLWISQSVKASAMAPNMFGILAEPPHVVNDLINALNIFQRWWYEGGNTWDEIQVFFV